MAEHDPRAESILLTLARALRLTNLPRMGSSGQVCQTQT